MKLVTSLTFKELQKVSMDLKFTMVQRLPEFSRVGKYNAMNAQPLGSFDMTGGIVNKHGLVGRNPQLFQR